MRKILVVLALIFCCVIISLFGNKNKSVDAISGLGYNGYNNLMEEFINKNN